MNTQDQAFEALSRWRAILRPMEQVNARIEAELSSHHNLCISGYEILHFLASRRGKTPLTQVCQHVDRSQPRISRLITQLEERGMVERYRADTDARAFQVAITRKGRRILQNSSATIIGILGDPRSPWPSEEAWRSWVNGQPAPASAHEGAPATPRTQ